MDINVFTPQALRTMICVAVSLNLLAAVPTDERFTGSAEARRHRLRSAGKSHRARGSVNSEASSIKLRLQVCVGHDNDRDVAFSGDDG